MKLKDVLKYAENKLKDSGIKEYKSDARFLVSDFLKGDLSLVIIMPGKEVDIRELEEMLDRRIGGVPCQYVTKNVQFMSLDFEVSPDVLIPRQDTELLVETIMKTGPKSPEILDICTGSGCIAISLSKYINCKTVRACDISEKALEIARKNADKNGVEAEFYKDDILASEKYDFKYDIVVSNPPYIETQVVSNLDSVVKDYEPRIALDGGEDGLTFYRKIAHYAAKVLKKDGLLALEIGYNQAESVREILLDNGYENITLLQDLSGNDRVLTANLKKI